MINELIHQWSLQDTEDQRLERVVGAVGEVVGRGSEEERRRVHLFLLINTDLGWREEELLENDAFR